jgi:hypothetical protein
MILCGEARDVDAMREAQPKPIYRQLKTIIESRMISLVKRVKDFIPQGDLIRQNVMVSVRHVYALRLTDSSVHYLER